TGMMFNLGDVLRRHLHEVNGILKGGKFVHPLELSPFEGFLTGDVGDGHLPVRQLLQHVCDLIPRKLLTKTRGRCASARSSKNKTVQELYVCPAPEQGKSPQLSVFSTARSKGKTAESLCAEAASEKRDTLFSGNPLASPKPWPTVQTS